jgi:hypothetical protein
VGLRERLDRSGGVGEFAKLSLRRCLPFPLLGIDVGVFATRETVLARYLEPLLGSILISIKYILVPI